MLDLCQYLNEEATKTMNTFLYIDESGSINNHNPSQKYFVIAVVRVKGKGSLRDKYNKFIQKYTNRLKELDVDKFDSHGNKIKTGNIIFDKNGSFIELKGCQFDSDMRHNLVQFFKDSKSFEIFYIHLINSKLTDTHCKNKERVFNYSLKLALSYFISKGLLPKEDDYYIRLDNRNIKTDSRMSLDEYINTELHGSGVLMGNVSTEYFDSSKERLIQIADVFSNLYYSHLCTGAYSNDLEVLRENDILKGEFVFPLN